MAALLFAIAIFCGTTFSSTSVGQTREAAIEEAKRKCMNEGRLPLESIRPKLGYIAEDFDTLKKTLNADHETKARTAVVSNRRQRDQKGNEGLTAAENALQSADKKMQARYCNLCEEIAIELNAYKAQLRVSELSCLSAREQQGELVAVTALGESWKMKCSPESLKKILDIKPVASDHPHWNCGSLH